MKYLLDTNICSYIIRSRDVHVIDKYDLISNNDQNIIGISPITCTELTYGALLKPSIRELIEFFIEKSNVLPFDKEASRHYADIMLSLKKAGTPIGVHDMQIAAHARSLGAILVTNNEKHFRVIPGMLIENWAKTD